jgi:hypothetical protein
VGRPALCSLRDRSRAWTVFLVRSLPSTHAAAHWDIAWAGFDIGLALLLLGVAVAGWRRSAWLEGTATAAAALLVVDAWFDVMTSSTHLELAIAIGEAVLIELPLAALCYLLARDAEQVLRRRTTQGVRRSNGSYSSGSGGGPPCAMASPMTSMIAGINRDSRNASN